MGLSSIFKRKTALREPTGREPIGRQKESAATREPVDEVHRARTRARQRLIGAVVLLAIGIIGFPLVFETQPRPIPVDIPIDIPRKDGLPPLVMPTTRGGPAADVAPATPTGVAPARPDDVITESRDEADRDVMPPTTAPVPGLAASRAAAKTPTRTTAEARPDVHDDGARARALLDGKEPAAADAARFIVQVGAFADATAAHDTRLKIEKLGMKTYTQVASTPAGNRIRVRVGPFGTRDEADKALARARSAGLSAVVLVL